WRLKHFLNQNKEPLELIAADLESTHPLPFSLRVEDDDAVTATLNSAVYAVTGAPTAEAFASSPTRLTFEYRDNAGVGATKEFYFQPTSYGVGFRTSLVKSDRPLSPIILWAPSVGASGATRRRCIRKPVG